MVAVGQQPLGVKADLVQHPGKEDNARSFNVVAAWDLIFHLRYYLIVLSLTVLIVALSISDYRLLEPSAIREIGRLAIGGERLNKALRTIIWQADPPSKTSVFNSLPA